MNFDPIENIQFELVEVLHVKMNNSNQINLVKQGQIQSGYQFDIFIFETIKCVIYILLDLVVELITADQVYLFFAQTKS